MSPRIVSFTKPQDIEAYVEKDAVTKTGATVVYGPYNNIPPSTNAEFVQLYQQPISIHYNHEQPVLEVLDLQRSVEISHWGANINTEDKIILHNAGPKYVHCLCLIIYLLTFGTRLKGHFSRLEHQTQNFNRRLAPHILPALSLHLPSGIRNPYYYDIIGNVSTSNLRVAPSVPKHRQGTQFSLFDLKPRYPILGGWNYSFTLGWDAPLEDSASYDKSTGRYIVEVPIMTPILGAVVNEEWLKIVLPEGATYV